MRQLPPERITPDIVFEHVSLDYAGPLYLKRGSVILNAMFVIRLDVCQAAVHLELVSVLTTEAFLAYMKRFIARRGRPCIVNMK